MIGVVMFALVGFLPSNASAQTCSVTVMPAWDLTENGSPALGANTREAQTSACQLMVPRTEVWIINIPGLNCFAGSLYGYACKKEQPNQAFYDAVAAGSTLAYGRWTGVSRHFIMDSGFNYTKLGSDRMITLNAGQPPTGPPRADSSCESYEMWIEPDGCMPYNTPILFPLTQSQTIKLTSVEDGVMFDMNADGVQEQTAWTARGEKIAFLAIDRDGNGFIDNGSELFGNHTLAGSPNGFDALDRMTNNGKGAIDSDDALFAQLLLWQDANHDGISQPEELQSASNIVARIGFGYRPHHRRDGHGNLFLYRGWAHVRTQSGKNPTSGPDEEQARALHIFDVFLKVQR